MKKIFFILIIFELFTGIIANADTEEAIYDKYIETASKYEYETINIKDDINNYGSLYGKLQDIAGETIYNCVKSYTKIFLLITVICLLSSVFNSFSDSPSVKGVIQYVTVVIFGVLYFSEFKSITDYGFKTIKDLTEYMNISFPGLVIMLSGSGYTATAHTMQSIFVLIANIISLGISRFFIPTIYLCSVLTMSNGICNSEDMCKIIKAILKFLKYFFGIILTVFSAVLTFTGLSASTSDGVAIKTAKYAISNFVPIVGNCLSETLNSIINSSIILKNSVGYICIIVVIMICLVPLIKIFISSCIIRLLSFVTTMVSNDKLTDVLENLSQIITLIGAMIMFITILFILILGIVASVGG